MTKKQSADLIRNLYLYDLTWRTKDNFIITNGSIVELEDGTKEPEIIDEYIGVSKKDLKKLVKIINDKIK